MRCFCEITEKDRGFDNFTCQIPRSSQFFVPPKREILYRLGGVTPPNQSIFSNSGGIVPSG